MMSWQGIVSSRSQKQIAGLPLNVRQRLFYLFAVWEERDRAIKLIEVIYVGTHEKASY